MPKIVLNLQKIMNKQVSTQSEVSNDQNTLQLD